MAKGYTTDSLIESVKRRAMLPESTQTFKDEDFLAFANEELDIGVVPLILSFHEDYLMRTDPVPLSGTKTRYQIPNRAMGNKIREVQFQDTSGIIYEMTRLFIEDLPYFQNGSLGSQAGSVRSFYMEGNEIVITPVNNTLPLAGNLLVSYYIRCSEIVSETRAATITAIDTTTGVVTLDTYPTVFPSVSGTLVDMTCHKSPFSILAFDLQPTAFGSTVNPSLTFDPADLPVNLTVGDTISLAEETIIPQIPVELHGMLSQRIAIRCLEALGDTQGLQNAMVKLQEMELKAGNIIDNRVEGAPLKVAPKHTFLRRSRTYMRR